MCGAERIVNIDISEGRQRFRKGVVVFLFPLMESEVFKEQEYRPASAWRQALPLPGRCNLVQTEYLCP